jgi:hypothetical protein
MPQRTGTTTIWNATVTSVGPQPEGANPTGVDSALLEGVPSCEVEVGLGDLLLLRTRSPHSVNVAPELLEAGERRMQCGSFIGRCEDDALILWS